MKQKWILAAGLIVAMAATTSFAHLPSQNDARFGIMRERMRMAAIQNELNARQGRSSFSFRGAWNADAEYSGSYEVFQGDTVQHGVYEGRPLFWWAKFWSRGDEPGGLSTDGGTSPWVMINSISASASSSGTPNFQWQGFGPGGTINQGQARIATWRNGAQGAYSFTHDDIGAMPFDRSIKPAFDLSKETGFEEIKTAWGVFVRQMEDNDWANAIEMVKHGHEMFNHSMDHTSAADQFQWFWPNDTIPDFDPSIPYAIRGLAVQGHWGNPAGQMTWPAPNNGRLTWTSDMVRIEGTGYWTQNAFAAIDGNGRPLTLTVTAQPGTERIVLPSGTVVFVKYDAGGKVDLTGRPADGTDMDVRNRGKIAAVDQAWFGYEELDKFGKREGVNWFQGGSAPWTSRTHNSAESWWINPLDIPAGQACTDWSAGGTDPNNNCNSLWPCPFTQPCKADQGVPGLIVKVATTKAWDAAGRQRNMKDANDTINKRIYELIQNPGKYFPVGKRSEYYGYPFDAYSLESHRALNSFGILQARGGSKTPTPMLGDFFHPYAIDFDAFWIDRSDWTPASQGRGFVYPDNAHVWLGLNEMVDKIIESRGYMIREFHAVADIADGAWHNGQRSNMWPLNNSSLGQGGWWGGITKNQLRVHYNYLKDRIDDGRLVVYTPSEAVKYRLTANVTSNPQLLNNILTVTFNSNGIDPRQIEEISVIVGTAATQQMNVEYVQGGGNPRLAPKRLNAAGTAWSINFNPSRTGGVRLIPGQPFVDPEWDCPNCPQPGDCDDPFDPNCNTFIRGNVANRAGGAAFTGIQNGQINLRLAQGNYTVQLFNVQGRVIGSSKISATDGVNMTGIRTDNLGRGIFVLQVKNAQGAQVLQHRLMLGR